MRLRIVSIVVSMAACSWKARWSAGMVRRQLPPPSELTSHNATPVLKISRTSLARAVSVPRTSSDASPVGSTES